jgi:hypothetical protein
VVKFAGLDSRHSAADTEYDIDGSVRCDPSNQWCGRAEILANTERSLSVETTKEQSDKVRARNLCVLCRFVVQKETSSVAFVLSSSPSLWSTTALPLTASSRFGSKRQLSWPSLSLFTALRRPFHVGSNLAAESLAHAARKIRSNRRPLDRPRLRLKWRISRAIDVAVTTSSATTPWLCAGRQRNLGTTAPLDQDTRQRERADDRSVSGRFGYCLNLK